jgi:hypothetical protein
MVMALHWSLGRAALRLAVCLLLLTPREEMSDSMAAPWAMDAYRTATSTSDFVCHPNRMLKAVTGRGPAFGIVEAAQARIELLQTKLS